MKIVKVGTFGRFRFPISENIANLWKQIEDIYMDENYGFIGIYNPFDLLHWTEGENLLSKNEIDMLKKKLV